MVIKVYEHHPMLRSVGHDQAVYKTNVRYTEAYPHADPALIRSAAERKTELDDALRHGHISGGEHSLRVVVLASELEESDALALKSQRRETA